ncbi:hypothetical protein [Flagellimonas myxillae]|uniref:hypothetical protein n=1 Tax=Flagellimonas myxillae TaxID=2942214 RepID=UPI00201F15EC|nr:hypothetical protein [Muricauda myxillae]MCL6267444.1 hypothetical protein [Muricauda myxillae]
MKNKLISSLGKTLMRLQPLKVVIVDDVKTYFNEQMLNLAMANGNLKIERYYKCDQNLLNSFANVERDIIILDIKGTIDKNLGNDGFDIARYLANNTNTFIVITSAHKYHLKNQNNFGDYVLEERLLTPIDFVEELNHIINLYLKNKIGFYKKGIYRVGKYVYKISTST